MINSCDVSVIERHIDVLDVGRMIIMIICHVDMTKTWQPGMLTMLSCWHNVIHTCDTLIIFSVIKIINIYHQSSLQFWILILQLVIFGSYTMWFWVSECHHHEEDMPAIIFQFQVPFITNQSITILSLLHLFIKLTNQPNHENEFKAWLGLFQVSQILKWSEKI